MALKQVFTIPKISSLLPTESGLVENLAQIKYLPEGIFEKEQLLPVLNFYGDFKYHEDRGASQNLFQYEEDNETLRNTLLTDETIDTFCRLKYDEDGYRLDVTPLVLYGLDTNGLSKVDLQDLDIKFLIDKASYDNTQLINDDLHTPEWVQLEPGFYNYNNNSTYGYRWKITKEVVGSDEYYYLDMDVPKDGLKLVLSSGVPPTIPLNLSWKIKVTRKETFTHEFNLGRLVSNTVKNVVKDTKYPVSGAAVIKYLTEDIKLNELVLQKNPYSIGEPPLETKFQIYANNTSFYSGPISFYANQASLRDHENYITIKDNKITFTTDNPAYLATALANKNVREELYNVFGENDFITKKVLLAHESMKDGAHGIKQGHTNGFNADKLDSLHIGQPGVTLNEATLNPNNYIPFVEASSNTLNISSNISLHGVNPTTNAIEKNVDILTTKNKIEIKTDSNIQQIELSSNTNSKVVMYVNTNPIN